MVHSARPVLTITTGMPVDSTARVDPGGRPSLSAVADPLRLTSEEVADLLERAATTSLDVAVRRLDELLDQLRPAAEIRHLLTGVPPSTMREAVALVAHRRETCAPTAAAPAAGQDRP